MLKPIHATISLGINSDNLIIQIQSRCYDNLMLLYTMPCSRVHVSPRTHMPFEKDVTIHIA